MGFLPTLPSIGQQQPSKSFVIFVKNASFSPPIRESDNDVRKWRTIAAAFLSIAG